MKWDSLLGDGEFEHKPRIMIFVELFEKRHKGKIADNLLTTAACIAIAMYLFGPLEEEDLYTHALFLKKRVQDYRNSLH